MSRVKKLPQPRKRQGKRSWLIALSAAFIIIIIGTGAYLSTQGKNKGPEAKADSQLDVLTNDPAFNAFANQFLGIMRNLNSSQTTSQMLAQVPSGDNQTDLFKWESTRLTFSSDVSTSLVNPFQILSWGKGVCLQWSIVYVSACLALGHQSRLCVAVDTGSWSWIHVWAEDYYNGAWVHVDPSDKVWDQPHRYLGPSWQWGQYLGTQVKVYAFEDNSYQDVTSKYSA